MTHTTLSHLEMEELAVLDAWGLLSGEDLARFEAAFLALDAAQHGHLRSIQNACTAEAAAPADAPPAQLRAQVLQRLKAVQDMEQLRRFDAAPPALTPPPLTPPPLTPPPLTPPQGFFASVGTWRLAALILLAVSITLVVMNRDTTDQYNRLLDEHTLVTALGTIQSDMTSDEQAAFVAMLRRPDVWHAYISADEGPGLVRVAVDEATGETFVLAMDLAGRPTPCTLELETADGDVIELASLRTDRPIDARRLQLDVAILDGATFRIRGGDGQVIGSTLA